MLLNKIWAYFAEISAAIAAILTLLFVGKKMGKDAAAQKQTEQAFKEAKQSNEIDDEVHNLSDAELFERLRKHTRD